MYVNHMIYNCRKSKVKRLNQNIRLLSFDKKLKCTHVTYVVKN